MSNHEANGHSDDNGHDNTEGSRQYYPKGWHLPLVGLVTIALGFALLGGFIFNISGTDKWGKTEQCCNGEGACCKDGDKDACKDACKDGDKDACKDKNNMPMAAGGKTDSTPKNDSMKPADHH